LLGFEDQKFRSTATAWGQLQLTMPKPEQASPDSLRNLQRDLVTSGALAAA
jgi:hypothetical protein